MPATPWARALCQALAGLLGLLAWDASGLDMAVAQCFGNAAGFAWRDAWWASRLLHDGGRWMGLALFLVLLADALRPFMLGPGRRERLFWLGVIVMAWLLVPGLKRLSATSCPWELAAFGGKAAYLPHWLPGRDGGTGHCFPSGHAATGFAFFGLHFLWRPHHPRLALWLLVAAACFGAACGLTQVVRGAHFASHVFWSAWLCWVWCVGAEWVRLRHLLPLAHERA